MCRGLSLMVAAVVASACASIGPGGGATFPGVVLQGRGVQARLGWKPDSPVARGLRPGTLVVVVASYEAENGRITGEPVSQLIPVKAGMSELLFTLAETTRHPPAGPVCLRLRAGHQSLPLRYADKAVADALERAPTDGFQFPAWRDRVLATTRLLETERNRSRIESALGSARQVQERAEARLAGFRAAGPTCAAISPAGTARKPSRNVIEPGRWEAEAELECSSRLATFLGKVGQEPLEFAKLISDSLVGAGGETAAAALRLNEIIGRRAPALVGFQTRLPRVNPLGTSSETDQALRELKVRGPAGFNQVLLGITSAFDSCLPEVRDQFKLAWNAWQAVQASNLEAELDAARREARLLECQAAEADAAKASGQRQELEARVAVVDAERVELDRLRPAGDGGIVDLLVQRCDAESAGITSRRFAPLRQTP